MVILPKWTKYWVKKTQNKKYAEWLTKPGTLVVASKWVHWKERWRERQWLLSFSSGCHGNNERRHRELIFLLYVSTFGITEENIEIWPKHPCHLGASWRFALSCIKCYAQIGQVYKSSIYTWTAESNQTPVLYCCCFQNRTLDCSHVQIVRPDMVLTSYLLYDDCCYH